MEGRPREVEKAKRQTDLDAALRLLRRSVAVTNCKCKGMSVGRNFGHPKLTRPRGQMYCPSTEMVSSL
jgi:hypothetical protein